MVNTADSRAFADAIVALCHDPARARAMGAAAANRVREHFSIEREAQKVMAVYQDVMAEVHHA